MLPDLIKKRRRKDKVFQSLHDFRLAWGLLIHARFDELGLLQVHRCVRNRLQVVFFRFLSSVVETLCVLHTLKSSCIVCYV